MTTIFSINLNKIALLRNSRGRDYPSVIEFAKKALDCGCKSLTLHPRPDARHATKKDIFDLIKLRETYPDFELNIEGYPSEDFLQLVIDAKANQCTLVPDDPQQLTSDHGWDVITHRDFLTERIAQLKTHAIRTSLFIDPDVRLCENAYLTGTDRVELYTESYAQSHGSSQQASVLQAYAQAARAARNTGLAINAGHDLNLENLADFLQHVEDVAEVSIGHAAIVESLELGFESVIKAYLVICHQGVLAKHHTSMR